MEAIAAPMTASMAAVAPAAAASVAGRAVNGQSNIRASGAVKAAIVGRRAHLGASLAAPKGSIATLALARRQDSRVKVVRAEVAVSTETATKADVEFEWFGEASSVDVCGSFTNWSDRIPLSRGPTNKWTGAAKLPPGTYEYKFVINGTDWQHVDALPSVTDSSGNCNNILVVKDPPPAATPSPSPATPAAPVASAEAENAPPPAPAAPPAKKAAPAAKAAAGAKAAPAGKAPGGKKGKADAKPIKQLFDEDVIPLLLKDLQKNRAESIELAFEDNVLTGKFINTSTDTPFSFYVYFPDGTVSGSRAFSLAAYGAPPSNIEPFMIDEKVFTADLIAFWITKRLQTQKSCFPLVF